MLQPEGEDGFLDFAAHGAFLRQEQVFGELLRQGRAALHAAAPRQVAEHRAGNADGVNAKVAVKAPVLNGNKGFGQVGRQLAQVHRRAAGITACGDQRAILAQNRDIGRALGHRKLVDRRQLVEMIDDKAADADQAPDRQHKAPVEQRAEKSAPLASGSGAFSHRLDLLPALGSGGIVPAGAQADRPRRLCPLKTRLDPLVCFPAAPKHACPRPTPRKLAASL